MTGRMGGMGQAELQRRAEVAESTLTVLCALLAARQTEHGPVRYPTDIDKTAFAEGYQGGRFAFSFGGGEISIVKYEKTKGG